MNIYVLSEPSRKVSPVAVAQMALEDILQGAARIPGVVRRAREAGSQVSFGRRRGWMLPGGVCVPNFRPENS